MGQSKDRPPEPAEVHSIINTIGAVQKVDIFWAALFFFMPTPFEVFIPQTCMTLYFLFPLSKSQKMQGAIKDKLKKEELLRQLDEQSQLIEELTEKINNQQSEIEELKESVESS